MIDANLGIIILCAAVALIIGVGAGFFIGRRTGKEKERISELETQLEKAIKDMEVYRVQVNAHFKKTSELFRNMTDSYKAVYVHLADSSQSLCTTESAMLRPADNGFLTLPHVQEEKVREVENSMENAEEPLPAEEEESVQPETEPDELKKQQEAIYEGDQPPEEVKEPEDLFFMKPEEVPGQEESGLEDEEVEISEENILHGADAVGVSAQYDTDAVEDSSRHDTDAVKENEKTLV